MTLEVRTRPSTLDNRLFPFRQEKIVEHKKHGHRLLNLKTKN
jgi:hypothetical protein